MNTRQRSVLIAVAVVIAGMTLYPPYYYPRGDRLFRLTHGYDWLLGGGYGRVEVELLFVQLLAVCVIGAIAYVLFGDKRP